MAIKLIPTIYPTLFWWRVTPRFFQITSLSALINYFPPVDQNNYVFEKFELLCYCPLDMIWEFMCALPTKVLLFCLVYSSISGVQLQFRFFWSILFVFMFLYDKINYIVLRNESEVITQGNLRPRPLIYWPSNCEVNTSRLRSAVILLQI